MKFDTAGDVIPEFIAGCDCGLTGGCEKCSPLYARDREVNQEEEKRYTREELEDAFSQGVEFGKKHPDGRTVHFDSPI